MRNAHPIILKILEHRSLEKQLGLLQASSFLSLLR